MLAVILWFHSYNGQHIMQTAPSSAALGEQHTRGSRIDIGPEYRMSINVNILSERSSTNRGLHNRFTARGTHCFNNLPNREILKYGEHRKTVARDAYLVVEFGRMSYLLKGARRQQQSLAQ